MLQAERFFPSLSDIAWGGTEFRRSGVAARAAQTAWQAHAGLDAMAYGSRDCRAGSGLTGSTRGRPAGEDAVHVARNGKRGAFGGSVVP
jgi:hypothetical protein